MITREEIQQDTKPVCFCELCVPSFSSLPTPREQEEETVPEQKSETVVALAA